MTLENIEREFEVQKLIFEKAQLTAELAQLKMKNLQDEYQKLSVKDESVDVVKE